MYGIVWHLGPIQTKQPIVRLGIPTGSHQDAEHSEPTTPVGLGQDTADAELSEFGHHLSGDSRSSKRAFKGEGDSWILEIRIFNLGFHGYQAEADLAAC